MTTPESKHRLDIGRIRITAVSDGVVPMPIGMLFPETSEDIWDPYRDRFPEAFDARGFMINLGSFVVRSAEQTGRSWWTRAWVSTRCGRLCGLQALKPRQAQPS